MKKPPTRLDYKTQADLLTYLLPIVERSWSLLDAMRSAGWDIVMPRLQFEESFGNAEEISEHRHIILEQLKFGFATPNIRFHIGGPPYVSPYLEELRQQRDAKRGREFDPATDPRWKKESSPCLARMERLRSENRAEFTKQMSFVETAEEESRIREIATHATGMTAPFLKEIGRPERCYAAALEAYSKPLGFELDRRRSHGATAVYSKPLLDGWHLCLSADRLAWYPGRRDGEAGTVLSLQNAVSRASLKSGPFDRFLMIEYTELIRHFEFLTRRFRSLEELEILVASRMHLLGLVTGEIETNLIEALKVTMVPRS